MHPIHHSNSLDGLIKPQYNITIVTKMIKGLNLGSVRMMCDEPARLSNKSELGHNIRWRNLEI